MRGQAREMNRTITPFATHTALSWATTSRETQQRNWLVLNLSGWPHPAVLAHVTEDVEGLAG